METSLTLDLILRAYAMGIFPMGGDDGTIRWYSPDPRCIIDLAQFHVPKRLARTYRQKVFEIQVDSAWDEVIRECACRQTTWINDEIVWAYTELYQAGLAHSVEAYKDGVLAGGLYGVTLGGAFMGESMFHRITDASKICLIALVERLKKHGYILLDSQYITNHLRTFGACLIPREAYLSRLEQALRLNCHFK
ncbi:MAG: leucyl/phenylalanyl-tRNA--protein transferase [Candidatus Melainabacteria bacterium]|nr:leucyl/phenylalanyl-tRNA--protein transferase [Candidatus Melainabacteria bacterium]